MFDCLVPCIILLPSLLGFAEEDNHNPREPVYLEAEKQAKIGKSNHVLNDKFIKFKESIKQNLKVKKKKMEENIIKKKPGEKKFIVTFLN